MRLSQSLQQDPQPGSKFVKFAGDTVTFTVTLETPCSGRAWVRTNIGHADVSRREIIRQVEYDETPLKRDWFDIPMHQVSPLSFRITLPLTEVGHFEAKCLFIENQTIDPVWPEGENTTINVEPADTCCANIIYNAFVRQFGKNKGAGPADPDREERIRVLDQAGYTVIPSSGTFRDLSAELDFIMGELGCRIIQLLPIHPTPTTFARMGRFGSPYAALDFTGVDTALVQFDPAATPLEQFTELVDAIHQRNGKIVLDIAVNHTGWGAEIHETHPEWLVRDEDGRIVNPGAWGITWEDLTKLDYSHKELWRYVADIFLIWCRRGVDGFRCDAGYMIPIPAWTYIIAKVRAQFPDTLFFLEGLGGKISVCRDLLDRGNFNWAYSELFQNYDRQQIENYLPGALDIAAEDGLLVHFAETHDNLRLAATSKEYAKLRTAFCAMASVSGAFGFANGVEWLATEKIVVHECPSLNWGAGENQVAHIRRLNVLLHRHPAFGAGTRLKLIHTGPGNHIALLRHHEPTGKQLLILANLDDKTPTFCQWRPQPGLAAKGLLDLITGGIFTTEENAGESGGWLEAGQVVCLTPDAADLALIGSGQQMLTDMPGRILQQQYRQQVLELRSVYALMPDPDGMDMDRETDDLARDPETYIRSVYQSAHPASQAPGVFYWNWPEDIRRCVMVPHGQFLIVRSAARFTAQLVSDKTVLKVRKSLPAGSGIHFAVFPPIFSLPEPKAFTLNLSVFSPDGPRHHTADLRLLPAAGESLAVGRSYSRSQIHSRPLMTLQTNGRGAMLRTSVSWAMLFSRYDALLAANLNPNFPEDRRVMFTRCRAWVVFQGYSYEINGTCLERFDIDDKGHGHWRFRVPVGRGRHIVLTISARMTSEENRIRLFFLRHPAKAHPERLSDSNPVRLILRPDIEDRGFHDTTKAYTGPEKAWPKAVSPFGTGFLFSPAPDRHLKIAISDGRYHPEPEWQYMVHRPVEAQRGLDPESDLFSPGYFSSLLSGDTRVVLAASAGMETPGDISFSPHDQPPVIAPVSVAKALADAMDQFVVKREAHSTVIAGYPWFLDWGRDTLIFCRGLIAGGQYDKVADILAQFGKFEHRGTLPNMIRGENADNRDTSDAPLWFCVCCSDLLEKTGGLDFLDTACGNRTLKEVLLSIGAAYCSGTPNGIAMDPDTGLVFSPSHFTWMDTNYPAGTPRQGYPIEIQALWYKSVDLLGRIDASEKVGQWQALAARIQASILRLFHTDGRPYLADCLHAEPGQAAENAQADDALRPNQLLAITLSAVTDPKVQHGILTACQKLLVPGAIRSLADREYQYPIAVYHNGRLLNDPNRPYQGRYGGDEDTQRKPAYHNGTAWTWPFPLFAEAYAMAYGEEDRQTARSLLTSSLSLLDNGCVGQIPEILDGNAPHAQRGCDAQAWGVSELFRVWQKLSRDPS